MKKKFNPAFWLMIVIFLVGLIATIYTVVLIGFGIYSKDYWFGFDKDQLERYYASISSKLEAFEKSDFSYEISFQPQINNNKFMLAVYDQGRQLFTQGQFTLYISRPDGSKYQELSLVADQMGKFMSAPFDLEAGGIWIFQLRIETDQMLALQELVFHYDQEQQEFIHDEDYRFRSRSERFPDLKL